MSTIKCNIVSPEGELFSGPVELLSAEGGAGEIAITPRHAPVSYTQLTLPTKA